MKILLTGASGMVGRNLLEHSQASSHEWLTPGHRELDLADYKNVLSYVDQHQPDLVIHAAGKVGGIQANIREPVKFLVANIDMGRNIVLAAASVGVPRLLNLGSSCMYPRDHTEPLRESELLSGPLEPTNEGYALAKILTAKLANYVGIENKNLSYKTLVPCNLYGKYDKFDPQQSHLIPAIIHKIHAAKKSGDRRVEIWGDGEARREFMYSEDLAGAIYYAISSYTDMPSLVNIGVGIDSSINEYYEVVASAMNFSADFVHDLSKPVGMQRKLLDVSNARKWGWEASISLHEGIDRTCHFYLSTLGADAA